MANIVDGGIYRLQIWCQDEDQASVNTIYFEASVVTPGLDVTEVEVATAYDGTLGPIMQGLMNNNAFYRGIGFRNNGPGSTAADIFVSLATGPGTAGAVSLPRQTAGLFSGYDGNRGKGARCRLYAPFPAAASNVTDGVPSNAYFTQLGLLAGAVYTRQTIAGVSGGQVTMIPVIRHTRRNKAPVIPPDYTQIVRVEELDEWATQRRRGSFGRPNKVPGPLQ